MKWVLTLLLLAGSALAQDCPARVVDAYSTGTRGFEKYKLVLKVENTSDRDIEAVKMGVIFIDAVGDETKAPYTYTIFGGIRKGAKEKVVFGNYIYANSKGTKAWVIKIMFKDGTVWENPDPGNACVAVFHK
jgi:hypothetical protein